MLIPLRTDAPVYHAPWATIGLIVVNVIMQIWASATDYEHAEPLVLAYGSFMPHQWISSVFLHAGWMHLVGNMIFLWVFGLVIEGKIGWWRFLAIYGTIAATSGMIEQSLMLGGDGGSLGASGVIFGLVAIAMIWAPDNEIDCLLLFFRVQTVELSIKAFAGVYILWQFLEASLSGFGVGSAVLHLIGASCGLPIGIVMVRRRWVNCEGWDWFSRRDRQQESAQKPRKDPASSAQDRAALDEEFRASFIALVESGSLRQALQVWNGNGGKRWGAPIPVLERLVGMLEKDDQLAEAQPFIAGILAADPSHPEINLLQAQLLLRERRPAAALACLEAASARLKPGQQQDRKDRLAAQCAALQAEGVMEIDA